MVGASSYNFTDSSAIKGREDKFVCVQVALSPIVASWKESLFAHEWLRPDGQIKPESEMSEPVRQKRQEAERKLKNGESIEKPVLGLGILDNIEIGSGKDILLLLATHGTETIPVHIPKSHIDDFKLFIRDAPK